MMSVCQFCINVCVVALGEQVFIVLNSYQNTSIHLLRRLQNSTIGRLGDAAAQLVRALCYKPEGGGFVGWVLCDGRTMAMGFT
jgi:hypothetical protein